MPIVLGKNRATYWVAWFGGKYVDSFFTCWYIRDGKVYFDREDESRAPWHDKRIGKGLEFHAPKDWIPTPDAIPEGCFIKTPEGVERCCNTCPWRDETISRCVDLPCIGEESPKWCPRPDTKPEKQEYEVGQWVWYKGEAAEIFHRTADYNTLHVGGRDKGGVPNCDLRPVKVGDKIQIVDEPKSHTLASGYKGKITKIDTGDDEVPLQVDGTWADTEDIRLLED